MARRKKTKPKNEVGECFRCCKTLPITLWVYGQEWDVGEEPERLCGPCGVLWSVANHRWIRLLKWVRRKFSSEKANALTKKLQDLIAQDLYSVEAVEVRLGFSPDSPQTR